MAPASRLFTVILRSLWRFSSFFGGFPPPLRANRNGSDGECATSAINARDPALHRRMARLRFARAGPANAARRIRCAGSPATPPGTLAPLRPARTRRRAMNRRVSDAAPSPSLAVLVLCPPRCCVRRPIARRGGRREGPLE